MNKQLLAALLLAAAVSGAGAETIPSTVNLSLELVKNDKAVWTARTLALKGRLTSIAKTRERAYAASCVLDENGEAAIKPGTLTTGFQAYFTPVQVDVDGAIIDFAFSYAELLKMKTITSKGCAIDAPSTHGNEASTVVRIKMGEKVELPFVNGADKYVLVLRSM